ncbi:hypothetical protein [Acuticoccus kandeliae]|nr:hypothetical protein [Acuticoccus kandeliae]
MTNFITFITTAAIAAFVFIPQEAHIFGSHLPSLKVVLTAIVP